jgi:hypothetical protein
VVEADDGSGWTKVSNSQGKRGLVPASYVGDHKPDEGAPGQQGTGRQGGYPGAPYFIMIT